MPEKQPISKDSFSTFSETIKELGQSKKYRLSGQKTGPLAKRFNHTIMLLTSDKKNSSIDGKISATFLYHHTSDLSHGIPDITKQEFIDQYQETVTNTRDTYFPYLLDLLNVAIVTDEDNVSHLHQWYIERAKRAGQRLLAAFMLDTAPIVHNQEPNAILVVPSYVESDLPFQIRDRYTSLVTRAFKEQIITEQDRVRYMRKTSDFVQDNMFNGLYTDALAASMFPPLEYVEKQLYQ